MKRYTLIDGNEVAHNELRISDDNELQDFLLNALGSSNEFDEEIDNFMFVQMSGTKRTFELTGDQEGEKVIVNIFEPNGKLFHTKSFYLKEDSGSIEDGEDKDNLIDALISQIKKDIENGDTTVLAEILETKDTKYLKSCLPEEGI